MDNPDTLNWPLQSECYEKTATDESQFVCQVQGIYSPFIAVHTVAHIGIVHLQLQVVLTQQQQRGQRAAGTGTGTGSGAGRVAIIDVVVAAIGIHLDSILKRVHGLLIVPAKLSAQVII